jgi:hypothetical protein
VEQRVDLCVLFGYNASLNASAGQHQWRSQIAFPTHAMRCIAVWGELRVSELSK